MIINVPAQDGRGMGISFKLATLWLQDTLGVDTVESASMIAPGGVIDIRTYSGIIGILKFLIFPKPVLLISQVIIQRKREFSRKMDTNSETLSLSLSNQTSTQRNI